MTASEFAERLAGVLVAHPGLSVTSAGIRHGAGIVNGALRPAVDVELAAGDCFRLLVDRVELKPAP